MYKRMLLIVSFFLIFILTACNMPTNKVSDIAVIARQTQQARQIQQAGQANTPQPQPVQLGSQMQSNGDLVITDTEVSASTFYYPKNTSCGATSVTIRARVTSSATVTKVGVLRLFSPYYDTGRNDAMQPVGGGWYELTIPTPDYDNMNISGDINLKLLFYAEDSAGNRVSTGGDVDFEPPNWPLNPLQLQIPSVNMLECQTSISQPATEAPQVVDMPTNTSVPPTQPPAPTAVPTQPPPPTAVPVTVQSGYVELRDWYTTEDAADIDFDGVPQLVYYAATSDYPDHSMGEYVAQGNVTNMALVSAATYDTCRAIGAWNTSIASVSAGQTYCFISDNNNGSSMGYFHIDKLENQGSEIDNWVIGISYGIWVP